MAENEPRYTLDRVVRLVISAATLVAVFALLRHLSDVLLPFVAAAVLAYLLNPLVTVFEQKMKRRGPAVALTLGGLGIVALALTVILIPLMIGQARHFGTALEELRNDLVSAVEIAPEAEQTAPAAAAERGAEDVPAVKSEFGWRELSEGWAEYRRDADTLPRSERFAKLREAVSGTYIGDVLDRAIKYTGSDEFNRILVDAAKSVIVGGWTAVAFVVHLVLGLTGLIVVLLYLVFLLLDYPEYARSWKGFLPPQYRQTVVEFWEQFEIALRRYFRGQAIVALCVGVLSAIGFSLIGLPMAVPFGLFVGLLNMVPYLQTVGLVPAMLLAGLRSVEGNSSFLASVLLTLLVFALVQLAQDAFLTPRVMGKATGLRPVAILLGLFIWGKLLGFMGLLLAIPLTCLGIAYYRRFVLEQSPEKTKLPSG